MKKFVYTIAILTSLMLLSSCEEQNEDLVQEINKNGSVQLDINIEHVPNDTTKDVVKGVYNCWKNGKIYNSYIVVDTIPSLGSDYAEIEDDNENVKKVKFQKEYELYINVK